MVGIHPANSVGDDIEAKWGETQQKFLEKVEKRRGIYCKWLEFPSFLLLGDWSSISAHWEFVHSRVVCWFFAVSCPRFCVKSFSLDYSLQHGPGEAQLVLSWGLQQREARRSEVQVLWSATAAGHGRIHLLVPGWFHRTQGAAMELKAASTVRLK